MISKPIVYLAYGGYDDLSLNLDKEIESIQKILSAHENFETRTEVNPTVHSLYDSLLKIGDRISIFHLAGYLSQNLNLAIDKPQSESHIGLIKVLSSLKNLKLVFLNGSSTNKVVGELLNSGVEAVIATSRSMIQDEQAIEFAINFYKNLNEGKSLLNSFELASGLIRKESKPTTHLQKGLTFNEQEEEFPWGLYLKEYENEILDWKISDIDGNLLKQDSIKEKIEFIESCINKKSPLGAKVLKLKENWTLLQGSANVNNDYGIEIFELKRQLIEKDLNVIIEYELKEVRGLGFRDKLVHQKVGRFYAIIIGINRYQYFTSLNGALKDAESFKSILEKKYEFDKIIFLPDAERDEIIDSFDELSDKIHEGDNIIIFYAGHGQWDDKSERGFWIPKNAEINRKKYWIENSTINNYVRDFQLCKHILIVSDSCYSGALLDTRSELDLGKSEKKIQILYKSKSRQIITSGAKEPVPDKSIFFKYLIETLEQNKENAISANTLFHKIRDRVIINSPLEQKPQIGKIKFAGDDGGDFILFRKKQNSH